MNNIIFIIVVIVIFMLLIISNMNNSNKNSGFTDTGKPVSKVKDILNKYYLTN